LWFLMLALGRALVGLFYRCGCISHFA
jgi:hypothetical protein